MSDPYGSFDNPYGVRPPYPGQYGEWNAGQADEVASWPPPTEPPPPGAPPPPLPYAPPVGPPVWGTAPSDRRPGVVTAGAVVAIVLSALAVLIGLIGVLGLIADHIDPDPGDYLSTADLVAGLIFCAVLIGASAFAIVLAALALGRRQWARITLVVLGFVSFAAVLPLITSVLLLLPSAGRWYAAPPTPPGR